MTGDTSAVIAANVKALRKENRWSLRELSDRLPKGAGWIGHSGIRAKENGESAFTVDNLTALAVVFGVSPLTLLLPQDTAALTGTPSAEPAEVLAWLRGTAPLTDTDDPFEVEAFKRRSLPEWAWRI